MSKCIIQGPSAAVAFGRRNGLEQKNMSKVLIQFLPAPRLLNGTVAAAVTEDFDGGRGDRTMAGRPNGPTGSNFAHQRNAHHVSNPVP